MAEGYQNNPITLITKYESISVTVNKSFGTDQATAWKVGNLVTVSLRTYNASSAIDVTSSTTLFTLPIGSRPPSTAYLIGSVVRGSDFSLQEPALFTITPSGVITATYAGSFRQIWICGSFPVLDI